MLEREIQKACLDYLAAKGIFAWRQNTTGIYDPKTGGFRFHGLRGVSDILGIMPDGRFLAAECKVPGKKPNPAQQSFLDMIADNGGVACCVHSVSELEADLQEAMNGVASAA